MKRIVSRDNAHFRELKKLCHSGRERRKTGAELRAEASCSAGDQDAVVMRHAILASDNRIAAVRPCLGNPYRRTQ